MNAGKSYEDYARSIPLLTPARERELSNIINGPEGEDRDLAIVELVNGNMRMALSESRRFRMMPDYIDILFDAHLGLTKAAHSFNSAKGRFSTWATSSIHTEIRDGILARSGSALKVSRYAAEIVYRLRKLEASMDDSPTSNSIKLAMTAILDAVPLYDDDGNPVDVVDPEASSMIEEYQSRDLVELILKVSTELNLSEDDIALVAGNEGIVKELAAKRGVGQSNVRMARSRLIWRIRRKILEQVGRDEYIAISAVGHLPGSSWR